MIIEKMDRHLHDMHHVGMTETSNSASIEYTDLFTQRVRVISQSEPFSLFCRFVILCVIDMIYMYHISRQNTFTNSKKIEDEASAASNQVAVSI